METEELRGTQGLHQNDVPFLCHVCVGRLPPLLFLAILTAQTTRFARIVIDEFTYADPAQMEGFRSIRANNRWILSGTPGIKNFGEIKQ